MGEDPYGQHDTAGLDSGNCCFKEIKNSRVNSKKKCKDYMHKNKTKPTFPTKAK